MGEGAIFEKADVTSSQRMIKEASRDLQAIIRKESKFGKELERLKAKEKAMDLELKKQRRLRSKYKKALYQDRCGKGSGKEDNNKGNVSETAPKSEEFEGGN